MNRLLFCLAACLVTVAPLEAQTRPLSYADYYRIERAGPTAISPDGDAVAFVRTRTLEEENRSHSEVWIARTDGASAPSRLTSPATESSNPTWSPDGALLAFSSRRAVAGEDSESSTWFLRMDGPGEAFQIAGLAGAPLFDPTNRWIAFTQAVMPVLARAMEPTLDPDEQKIVDRFDGRSYDWMQYRFDRQGYLPDPRDPYATPPAQIFILPREGGEPRQVTDMPVSVSGASWRPTGDGFAFVADEHSRDESTYPRADLWTVTLDGITTRLSDDEYNWRGPVWMPMNFLLIESLQKYAHYYGDSFQVEFPTRSGNWLNLWEVSLELEKRLVGIFRRDGAGRRAFNGDVELFQNDPHWRDLLLFNEYFHGEDGRGVGASHQTGWSATVAKMVNQLSRYPAP